MCRAVFLALAAFATAPSVFASLGFINFDGYWGTWGRMQVSSSRSYATRFKVRTESGQGSGDDTALNAICLIFNAGEPPLCSSQGRFGDWYYSPVCREGFMGAQFRLEAPQGSGDDTAGNNIKLWCANGQMMSAIGAPNNWGVWSPIKMCRPGKRICGIQTRVEDWKRNNDDTSLNGVNMRCC